MRKVYLIILCLIAAQSVDHISAHSDPSFSAVFNRNLDFVNSLASPSHDTRKQYEQEEVPSTKIDSLSQLMSSISISCREFINNNQVSELSHKTLFHQLLTHFVKN